MDSIEELYQEFSNVITENVDNISVIKVIKNYNLIKRLVFVYKHTKDKQDL